MMNLIRMNNRIFIWHLLIPDGVILPLSLIRHGTQGVRDDSMLVSCAVVFT